MKASYGQFLRVGTGGRAGVNKYLKRVERTVRGWGYDGGMHRKYLGWVALAVGLFSGTGRAACPVGKILTVDNDIPGSGYSEVKPENWTSYEPFACKNGVTSKNTFRYLTKYSGDGTATGKAIWKPAIPVAGVYEVVSGYRASVNRTEKADYYLYGDQGETLHKVVSQKAPEDDSVCKYVNMGKVTCVPGGDCRLVLDGDDKFESAAADVTTFKLVECLPEPPKNKLPTGNADHAGCENLSGWAYDPDTPEQAIEVHAYFGGPAGSPAAVLGLNLKADVHRPDLCGAIGSCAHGFFAPFPDQLRDGVPRPIHFYAIDSAGGPNAELPGSPLTVACAPPSQGTGGEGGQGGGEPQAGAGGEPGAGGSGQGEGGASGEGGAGPGGTGPGGAPPAGTGGVPGGGGSGNSPSSWNSSGGGGTPAGAGGAGGARPKLDGPPVTNEEASAEGGCAAGRGGSGGWAPGALLGALLGALRAAQAARARRRRPSSTFRGAQAGGPPREGLRRSAAS
jgi:hypothetical protein